MSGNNPVETKPAAPAAALTEPAAAAKAGKRSLVGGKQKYWLAAGVTCGLALAGGVYGYKYFTAAPGKVVAQTETPPVAPIKPPELPAKPPEPDDVLPPVVISPIKQVIGETPVTDFAVPDIKRPVVLDKPKPAAGRDSSDTTGPPLLPPPVPDKTDDAAPLIPSLGDAKKKPDDPFKATGPILGEGNLKIEARPDPAVLPTQLRERKDNDSKNAILIIPIGGVDPTTPGKKDDPIIPLPPSIPDTTGTKKDDSPVPPLTPPPDISPIVAPGVKKDDPKAPAIPTIPDISPIAPPPDVSPKRKDGASPMVPPIVLPDAKLPDPGPAPMMPPTTIGDPSVPPLIPGPKVEEKKKDMYDEDWHTERSGDTYALISREYYHTADYEAALKAYNKDRIKKDDIIRVPPTWVLEEKFPHLLNKPEKTAIPEAKPTGNIKFEPVAPLPGTRAGPAPIGRSNDEYRVTNPAGETIREIARKLYGNENAWKKVYDQNPDVDPTQPIPTGTTLRVAK